MERVANSIDRHRVGRGGGERDFFPFPPFGLKIPLPPPLPAGCVKPVGRGDTKIRKLWKPRLRDNRLPVFVAAILSAVAPWKTYETRYKLVHKLGRGVFCASPPVSPVSAAQIYARYQTWWRRRYRNRTAVNTIRNEFMKILYGRGRGGNKYHRYG